MSGTYSSRGTDSLRQTLAQKGLLLVEASRVRGEGWSLRSRRVSTQSLLAFVREFQHLIEAGVQLTQALFILRNRPGEPVLSDAISTTLAGIESGMTLDKAAARAGAAFDNRFLTALEAGVLTGEIGPALARLESFLALSAKLRRKLRSALAYPAFLMVLLVVVLAILMLFVLPRFAELYSEFNAMLPLATRILMGLVNWAPVWTPALVVVVVAAGLLIRVLRRREASRAWLDALVLGLPIVGPIIRNVELAQLSGMLVMLLRAKVPPARALEMASHALMNARIRAAVQRAAVDVRAGRSIAESLADADIYPPITQGMIRAGEAASALDNLLETVTSMHGEWVEQRIENVMALIEPAMILVVGIVLGAVIVTVYLPIFGISGVVQ